MLDAGCCCDDDFNGEKYRGPIYLVNLPRSCILRLKVPYIAIGSYICRLAVNRAILSLSLSAQPRGPQVQENRYISG
jgi:hypothetical protein